MLLLKELWSDIKETQKKNGDAVEDLHPSLWRFQLRPWPWGPSGPMFDASQKSPSVCIMGCVDISEWFIMNMCVYPPPPEWFHPPPHRCSLWQHQRGHAPAEQRSCCGLHGPGESRAPSAVWEWYCTTQPTSGGHFDTWCSQSWSIITSVCFKSVIITFGVFRREFLLYYCTFALIVTL